jgi:hypothetical protein
MGHVHETRARGRQGSSAGAVGAQPREEPLDDWLGDVSDDDWNEDAAERAQRGTPAYHGIPAPAGEGEPTVGRAAPGRSVDAAEARREVVGRRRLVAGLVLVVVLGLAVAIPVLLLRGGGQSPSPSGTEPSTTATTTPSSTETSPSSTATTPTTTSPSTTTPSTPTTPSQSGTTSFTLPEGTKLRLGEGDPAVIRALQQALTSAGYDPGAVDGTYGPTTKAAVTAFQQANGLTADGVVGPETAAALNTALASG